jgi:hypothetical protein
LGKTVPFRTNRMNLAPIDVCKKLKCKKSQI